MASAVVVPGPGPVAVPAPRAHVVSAGRLARDPDAPPASPPTMATTTTTTTSTSTTTTTTHHADEARSEPGGVAAASTSPDRELARAEEHQARMTRLARKVAGTFEVMDEATHEHLTAYVYRLVKYAEIQETDDHPTPRWESGVWFLAGALVLIDDLTMRVAMEEIMRYFTPHTLLWAAMLVATKTLTDTRISLPYMALVGGISTADAARLEVKFLQLISYAACINAERHARVLKLLNRAYDADADAVAREARRRKRREAAAAAGSSAVSSRTSSVSSSEEEVQVHAHGQATVAEAPAGSAATSRSASPSCDSASTTSDGDDGPIKTRAAANANADAAARGGSNSSNNNNNNHNKPAAEPARERRSGSTGTDSALSARSTTISASSSVASLVP